LKYSDFNPARSFSRPCRYDLEYLNTYKVKKDLAGKATKHI
jgi:hypothetical protein